MIKQEDKRNTVRQSGKDSAGKALQISKKDVFTGARRPMPSDTFNIYDREPADRLTHALFGRFSPGISHISILIAFFDWALHLSVHPNKLRKLNGIGHRNLQMLSAYILQNLLGQKPEQMVDMKEQDHRFLGDLWDKWPFNVYQQGFLLNEDWWDKATRYIPGVSRHHRDVVNFTTRQIIDIFSPSIIPFMNPYVCNKTMETGGMNFAEGAANFLDDYLRWLSGKPPEGSENFIPGKQVAITPGKVVFRNRLIELIQYQPQTDNVYAEPVMIVPAWIMKYYILDLSPNNSLVKYLVEKGHTVFMISWKNPDKQDRDLSFEDYLNLGVLTAIKVIGQIVPGQQIHAAGYCLGGTLLYIAAAYLAKLQDDSLKTITTFAAQVDFEEAGELLLFIDESQLDYIEDRMWEQGFLDGYQMAGAFYLLRSNDLIWSRVIHDYHMGERRSLNDLMAWNADTTRLPFKMHSEYLRRLFLNNELSEGRYSVNQEIIALTDIRVPIFSVGTVKDHVAPWESVYKIHLYSDTDVSFVLTTGGHNAGIVSEIGHPGRRYKFRTSGKLDSYLDPGKWQEITPYKEGSWWPQWESWLAIHSSEKVKHPEMGSPTNNPRVLYSAPGEYVMIR
ncbi:MAG: polyhydroxyalkanoic acid synthase [Saprospiraceae bacterium]|nr:polyhydroxyalkanoic acid synthase [Saprospiraceae bacterium]